MLSLIKSAGLLPVFVKLASWLIDHLIEATDERAAAKRKLQAAIERVKDNPRSEAQDVSDQWRTIKDAHEGTGTDPGSKHERRKE